MYINMRPVHRLSCYLARERGTGEGWKNNESALVCKQGTVVMETISEVARLELGAGVRYTGKARRGYWLIDITYVVAPSLEV